MACDIDYRCDVSLRMRVWKDVAKKKNIELKFVISGKQVKAKFHEENADIW